MALSNPRSLIDRFRRLKTLVIGDLMLDHYIWGTVSRISPEAPVPVVQMSRETEMPGGAGNVAVNMAALGADVHVVGLLGEDAAADRLVSLFQRGPIHTESTVRTPERPTIVKTRIIAQHQQVVRLDREVGGEFSNHLHDQMWVHVERLLPVDSILRTTCSMSQGAMNCPFLTLTTRPVSPQARSKSVCRDKKAGT